MTSSPRSVYYVTDTGTELAAVGLAADELSAQGITVTARHTKQLAAETDWADAAASSNVVVVSSFAGSEGNTTLAALKTAIEKSGSSPVVHVQVPTDPAELRDHAAAASTTTHDFAAVSKALDAGGAQAFAAVFTKLCDLATGAESAVPEVIKPLAQGFYSCETGPVADIPGSLAAVKRVGVYFPAQMVRDGNLAVVDCLVASLTECGVTAVPVFGEKFPDERLAESFDGDVLRVDDTFRHYFLDGDTCTIDALVTFHPLSLSMRDTQVATVYQELGVPVFQALLTTQSVDAWKNNPAGVTAREVATLSAQPEQDGVLTGGVVGARDESLDSGTGALTGRWVPLEDEVDALASLVASWVRLRHTEPGQRKVGIILHQHTPQLDRVGAATGLDAFASVRNVLQRLKEEGYNVNDVPASDEIASALTRQVVSGDGWIDGADAVKRAGVTLDAEQATTWHSELPATLREAIEAAWGEAPGGVYTYEGTTHLAVCDFGNVVVMVQPPRGILETMTVTSVHDGTVAPPHVYMNAYRWLREGFGAHALIHLGAHGSIEWLPGQALGLAADSATEVALGGLPNIYPYVVNNPGEVTQAKRRSHGVTISHLSPPVRRGGLHGELARIQAVAAEFSTASMGSPAAQKQVAEDLWDAVEDAGIGIDFGMDKTAALADVDHFVEHVHHYLLDLGDNLVNDGLHVLGEPPTGERLAAFVTVLLRHGSAVAPSLREELGRAMSLDIEELTSDASVVVDGRSSGDIVAGVDERAERLVVAVLDGKSVGEVLEADGLATGGRLQRALERAEPVAALIASADNELDAVVDALNGGFTPPGASGVPTRGDFDVFPTGRNMVTLDPTTLPTMTAHSAGVRAAEALLKRFSRWGDHADHTEGGSHRGESHTAGVGAAKRKDIAETLAVVLWGTATMRSRGEDIGQALHLLGTRPVWNEAGTVIGVEPIPLSELGRARVDVTLKISGLFRDAFPQAVELLDEAVRLVANLDEEPERNFVRAHVTSDVALYESQGRGDEAWEMATARVFGPAPGNYGTGVDVRAQTGTWESSDDMATTFVESSAFAYGGSRGGKATPEAFTKTLARVQGTVHNEATAESDMLASDARFSEHGGLIAAVTQARGEAPQSFVGEDLPSGAANHTLKEAVRTTARARLLNPRWIESMREAGYSGAAQLSMAVDAMSGWQATSTSVDDTLLDRVASTYLQGDTREWLQEANPHALAHIAGRFLDLHKRGMWDADDDALKLAMDAYMEAEGAVEDATDH